MNTKTLLIAGLVILFVAGTVAIAYYSKPDQPQAVVEVATSTETMPITAEQKKTAPQPVPVTIDAQSLFGENSEVMLTGTAPSKTITVALSTITTDGSLGEVLWAKEVEVVNEKWNFSDTLPAAAFGGERTTVLMNVTVTLPGEKSSAAQGTLRVTK